MRLEWVLDCELPEDVIRIMSRAADLCLTMEGIQGPCSATVRLCDDDAIQAVNTEQRGIASSTDVLSFPTVCYPSGMTAGSCQRLLRKEYDDESGTYFLGDIVISVPHVYRQAEEYGHSVKREATYLLVHGICHLMGYDHMTDEDKAKMRSKEDQILFSVSALREGKDDSCSFPV